MVSVAQDQEHREHTEGCEGKPQAPWLQQQLPLCSRTFQEVTAGGKSTRLKGLISTPTHPQPFCRDSQHCLLYGQGGLEPGGDCAAVGLVEPDHHGLSSVLSLGGVQTDETRHNLSNTSSCAQLSLTTTQCG